MFKSTPCNAAELHVDSNLESQLTIYDTQHRQLHHHFAAHPVQKKEKLTIIACTNPTLIP